MKGSLRTARRRCAIPTLIALTLILAACTAAPLGSVGTGAAGSGGQNHTPTTTTAPPVPVTELPGDGTKDVLPTAPISLSVDAGALHDVALISPSGTRVSGALSAAGNSWATTEVLGYDSTYTWSGTATGPSVACCKSSFGWVRVWRG